jgi:hypothetical protein
MDKIIIVALGVIGVLGLGLMFALAGGTVLWLVWPSAVQAFPGLVQKGYLVSDISWYPAVCLSFAANILIKSSSSSKD